MTTVKAAKEVAGFSKDEKRAEAPDIVQDKVDRVCILRCTNVCQRKEVQQNSKFTTDREHPDVTQTS